MQRAIKSATHGHWPADRAATSVVLDYDSRHRRRIRLACEDGNSVLLDLPKATALRDGDGLQLEDGGWIAVRAAPEDLVRVTCAGTLHLNRIAWHLGNRHCPAAIAEDGILIRRDHVIEDMLRGLGAEVTPVHAPFDPEGGAYDRHEQTNGHDHSSGHAHGHEHPHEHGHRHDR